LQKVREMKRDDWDAVAAIYRQGIAGSLATFETACPPYEKWDAAHLPFGRFVCENDGKITGWVALSPTSPRACFSGVAEVSIYIAEGAKRRGAGTLLLQKVIGASEQNGVWTLQSSIMRNNEPSLALHAKCGFRAIGYREKIARDGRGRWRDTVLMERRSPLPQYGGEYAVAMVGQTVGKPCPTP